MKLIPNVSRKLHKTFSKLKTFDKPKRKILILTISIATLILYNNITKSLLTYINRVSWKSVPWRDPDFQLYKSKEIIILRWTSYWGEYINPSILNSGETCKYLSSKNNRKPFDIPCRITFDRRYRKRGHALVFHSFDLIREEMPQERDPNQIWVYLQQESPIYTKLNLKVFNNIFNWTMTYRRDSDVYHPYSSIVPVSNASNHANLTKHIKVNLHKKTKLVAWIVSSCDSHSKREHFVKELQKYLPVDIYGSCGQNCPQSEDCYEHIAKSHKFYLSFENSLCTDYITEKFFNAMKFNIVPIVYGGGHDYRGRGNDDYKKVAPAGSYINVDDFKTVKDLAIHLLNLNENDDEYLKFFEWKNHFKVVDGQGWCNLCLQVFHHVAEKSRRRNRQKSKTYRDLWRWWNYRDILEDTHLPNHTNKAHYVPTCSPPNITVSIIDGNGILRQS